MMRDMMRAAAVMGWREAVRRMGARVLRLGNARRRTGLGAALQVAGRIR
jgi:hypothetical protein